jgi:hypothetical protein
MINSFHSIKTIGGIPSKWKLPAAVVNASLTLTGQRRVQSNI